MDLNDPKEFLDRNADAIGGPAFAISGDILRGVAVGQYKLFTWDTGQSNASHNYIGYRFIAPDGKVLFQGTDIGVPKNVAIDSDESIRSVLSFLTLSPGDTDEEYFSDYTEEQRAFAEEEAPYLSAYASDDPYEVEGPEQFQDIPGYEQEEAAV